MTSSHAPAPEGAMDVVNIETSSVQDIPSPEEMCEEKIPAPSDDVFQSAEASIAPSPVLIIAPSPMDNRVSECNGV